MGSRKKLKLSDKHGLNPSTSLCLFCREPKGLVLLGRVNREDDKAPSEGVYDSSPCDKCDALMKDAVAQGYVVILEMMPSVLVDGAGEAQSFSMTGNSISVKREDLKKIMGGSFPHDARMVGVRDTEYQEMYRDILAKRCNIKRHGRGVDNEK